MKKKREHYAWHKTTHDKTPYGKKIAQDVADYLKKGGLIRVGSHRDYCGEGFIFEEQKYYYCEISDGCCFYEIQSFATQKDFVNWLAVQNDHIFSKVNDENSSDFVVDNQCITKELLMDLSAPIESTEEIKNRKFVIKKENQV